MQIMFTSGLLFTGLVLHSDVLPQLALVVRFPQIVGKAGRIKFQVASSTVNLSNLSKPLSKPIAPTQMARAKVEVLLPTVL